MDSLVDDIINLISQHLAHYERLLLDIENVNEYGTLVKLFSRYNNGIRTLDKLLQIADQCDCILTGHTIKTLYYKYLRQDTDIDHIKLEFDIIASQEREFINQWFADSVNTFHYISRECILVDLKTGYCNQIRFEFILNNIVKCHLVVVENFEIETRDIFINSYMFNLNRIYIRNRKIFVHPETHNDFILVGPLSHQIFNLFEHQLQQIMITNKRALDYYKQLCKQCAAVYKNRKYSSSDFKKIRCLDCIRFEYCDPMISTLECDREHVCLNLHKCLAKRLNYEDNRSVYCTNDDDEEKIERLIIKIQRQYVKMYLPEILLL